MSFELFSDLYVEIDRYGQEKILKRIFEKKESLQNKHSLKMAIPFEIDAEIR